MGKYDSLISDASKKYGVNESIIRGVINSNSAYNPNNINGNGGNGLMGISPVTSKRLGVSNVFDAKENVDAGTRHLSQLIENSNGDVDRALKNYNSSQLLENPNSINGDEYVKSVKENGAFIPEDEEEESVKKDNNNGFIGNIIVAIICILLVLLAIICMMKAFDVNVPTSLTDLAGKLLIDKLKKDKGLDDVELGGN